MSDRHTVREVERAERVARYSGCVALGFVLGAAMQQLIAEPAPREAVALVMVAALLTWMLPAWWAWHRAEHSLIRRTR